jgi:GNAT superfamily N-acetyltransferase
MSVRLDPSTVHPEIRPARADEAARLSALALRSKAHWGYRADHMEVFRAELTVAPEDVGPQRTHVLESEGEIAGFYTLIPLDSGELELGHLFVEPDRLRRGFGAALFEHACRTTRAAGCARLVIQSDPNAQDFYRRLGALPVREIPSSIPGRSLPLLVRTLGDGEGA